MRFSIMHKMDEWERFDRKVVLCYTGYIDRYNTVRDELARVGLKDVEFIFDFPSPLKAILQSHIPTNQFTSQIGPFSCCMAHYSIAKQTYELGYDNVLVMEDDIRFLNNISLINEIVRALPDNYDYAQFERAKPFRMPIETYIALKDAPVTNKYWRPFSDLRGGGCYAMSRKGMKHIIDEMERVMVEQKEKLQSNDFYISRGQGLKKYFCYPNVACQVQITESNSDIAEYWLRNELDGVHYSAYNTQNTVPPITDEASFIHYLDKAGKRNVQVFRPESIKTLYNGWQFKPAIKGLLNKANHTTKGRVDAAIIWGYNTSELNRKALGKAYLYNIPVLFCEPGFISSGTTWANKSAPEKFRHEYSIMVDTKGQFFDATKATDIECLLNGNMKISVEQKAEARRLINKIVTNKVSKYNHQPIFTPKIGRDGCRKVLVVDQSYGDFSIRRGMADDSTFEKMLRSAIEDNPDADILVKTHPDTLAGKTSKRSGYYQDIKEGGNIYKVTFPINPYSLLEVCDKVYVCSSQFGLEALMAGKEVHVFGMPFYAGWGLTIDDQRIKRRSKVRSLEELFYIFYCIYTHWVDVDNCCGTTIDAVIDKMIALRDEYNGKVPTTTTLQRMPNISGYRLGVRRPSYRTPYKYSPGVYMGKSN